MKEMTREKVIELLKQFPLADIVKAVQEAYRRGYQNGYNAATFDDDIPF